MWRKSKFRRKQDPWLTRIMGSFCFLVLNVKVARLVLGTAPAVETGSKNSAGNCSSLGSSTSAVRQCKILRNDEERLRLFTGSVSTGVSMIGLKELGISIVSITTRASVGAWTVIPSRRMYLPGRRSTRIERDCSTCGVLAIERAVLTEE